jgi:hypothetical protein
MSTDSKLSVFDLVPLNEAASQLQISETTLMKVAAANELGLFYPAKQLQSFVLQLSEYTNHYDERGNAFAPSGDWFPLFDYNRDQKPILKELTVKQGEVLRLDEECSTSLLVNGKFNKLDLLNAQLDKNQSLLDGMNTNYNGGSLKWTFDPALDEPLSINDVFILESDIKASALKSNSDQRQSTSKSSNTALKVIGLLMHHLAKSPKYASGSLPNKSQIKALLLDLAQELDIDPYGLSKVDERLLSEAMKYLENQKN